MLLLPPAKDTCPICAEKHLPEQPHNALSLYYQYRFYGIRDRWPTWADAMAHCSEQMQTYWRGALKAAGHWTEPTHGEPIADPIEESFHQPIGDLSTPEFGSEYD